MPNEEEYNYRILEILPSFKWQKSHEEKVNIVLEKMLGKNRPTNKTEFYNVIYKIPAENLITKNKESIFGYVMRGVVIIV